MAKNIKDINIYLPCEESTRKDVAQALRLIADEIEKGCVSGIVGWSTIISWDIEESEEDDKEDEREEN